MAINLSSTFNFFSQIIPLIFQRDYTGTNLDINLLMDDVENNVEVQ